MKFLKKPKCIEKGKENDILSKYLYKFIKLEISKQSEAYFIEESIDIFLI